MNWKLQNEGPKWVPVLNAAEDKYALPRDLLARQAFEESSYLSEIIDCTVVSTVGARGIMQLMPQFFPNAGKNPAIDIDTAASYMEHLLTRFGRDAQVALAAYNWGEGNVHHQWKSFPAERRDRRAGDGDGDSHERFLEARAHLRKHLDRPCDCRVREPVAISHPANAHRFGRAVEVDPAYLELPRAFAGALPPEAQRPARGDSRPFCSLFTGEKTMTQSVSVGQAILALVESDLAAVAGSPVLQFLEDCKAANGNLGLEAAALLKLEAAAPGAGIQLEVTVQQQLLQTAITKLQTYLAGKAAA
jgi:hypothetical protein